MKNIKMKKIFSTYISMLVIAMLFGCHSVYSQYNKKVIDDKKVCIYIDIENNYSRLFLRKLKERPNVTTFKDCDYFFITHLSSMESAITNASGICIENKIKMNAYYTLYKYDTEKSEKIKDILENPKLYTFDQYTSGGFIESLSQGKGNVKGWQGERNREARNSNNLYFSTKLRISKLLPVISTGQDTEESSYMVNYNLLTSLSQSRFDAENQLIDTLAERIMNDVMVDIINSQQKQKCHSYYDEYLESYDVRLKTFHYKEDFLYNKNRQNEEIKNFIQNKCKLEFAKIEKEKQAFKADLQHIKTPVAESKR